MDRLTVYIGDIFKVLPKIPESSIDCIITSPPYWKQRDYKHPKQIGQEKSYYEYIKKLVEIFSQMKRLLKPTGTFFLNLGYKYENKNLLLIPEMVAWELQKSGWCLLNKIIWHKPNAMPSSVAKRITNVYEPVFLFVKEESKYQYYLAIDELRLPARTKEEEKKPEDLLGMTVRDSLRKDGKDEGVVKEIYEDKDGHLLARVFWKSGSKTIESIQDFSQESQLGVEFFCPSCQKRIENDIDLEKHRNCGQFPLPIFPTPEKSEKKKTQKEISLFPSLFLKDYRGKYSLSPENRGQSPGARLALFGEYLVRQRRYKIYQPLIADYLQFWRKKKGIKIKEIDQKLGYRDTAGHWFRKDTEHWGKGGSVPLPEDWWQLKKILAFDNLYDRLVTETHLVLQTVRTHPKGKNPGDVWSIKLQPILEAHFAPFPEELVRRCLLAGCPKDGTVLDPFAGSGTTGKVALELNRKAILIELIPEYLNIIKRRCPEMPKVVYVE